MLRFFFTAEYDNVPTPTEDAHRYVDAPPGYPRAFKNRVYEEVTATGSYKLATIG